MRAFRRRSRADVVPKGRVIEAEDGRFGARWDSDRAPFPADRYRRHANSVTIGASELLQVREWL